MYGRTDIAVQFGEQQWGGNPWDNFKAYVERSPITYAPNVKTPVLLLHGEADVRCPISQSEEYYTALKRLGKPVEFVRFPDQGTVLTAVSDARISVKDIEVVYGVYNDVSQLRGHPGAPLKGIIGMANKPGKPIQEANE